VPVIDDIPTIIDFHRRNEDHLAETEPPRPDDFYTDAHWRSQIKDIDDAHNVGAQCRYFIFASEKETHVIGRISLSQIFRGPFQACYLGYAIDQAHQGQGKMREAAQLLIDHAFHTLQLHRIMANYIPTNERSGRLLRRLGFTVEGYARDYLFINGAWRDHVLTSLTNYRLHAPPSSLYLPPALSPPTKNKQS